MNQSEPTLDVVMYHYVRDLPKSRFPRLKALLSDTFRQQVDWLAKNYEMATLESAVEFLQGRYQPQRSLCLLTFDDGLMEHYSEATPLLAKHHIPGIFFVITGCQEQHVVAPVHMNHFLMAELDWNVYMAEFEKELSQQTDAGDRAVDAGAAARTYPWDVPEVAHFKYLFNFVLRPGVRDRCVRNLFERHFGDEAAFSRELYFSWEQAEEMQRAGMVIGGHTHAHSALSRMAESEMISDLELCRTLLDRRLKPQSQWPFSYPYGKKDSYTLAAVERLQALGFDCAFSTEAASNQPHCDRYAINRIDCNVAWRRQSEQTA